MLLCSSCAVAIHKERMNVKMNVFKAQGARTKIYVCMPARVKLLFLLPLQLLSTLNCIQLVGAVLSHNTCRK